jgi:phospholipase/lecithinase/hemolysin
MKEAFKMRALCGACLSVGLSFSAASAASLDNLTVFGDSLSDPGNLFLASGGTFPPPPYVDGRVSDGPVWAEAFTGPGASPTFANRNFAHAGANALPDGDAIPDLPQQIALFGAFNPVGATGVDPTAALWFGANDLFGAIPGGAVAATATGVAAATAVGAAAQFLGFNAGFESFLLFNLPDLGRVPLYALVAPAEAAAASAGAAAFNAELALQAQGLRAVGYDVVEIDVKGLFDALLDDPAAFGLTDVTNPCVFGGLTTGVISVCDPATIPGRAFWDLVHPTAAVHAALAEEVRAAVAPVPLPASALLLLAAVAGLAAARRGV